MSTFDGETMAYVAMTIGSTMFFLWIYAAGAEKFFKSVAPNQYFAMTTRHQNIACSGVASSVNGVIMFSTSLYLLLTHNLHANICWTNDFQVRLLSCVEIGCYFADTLVLLRGNTETNATPYLMHHLAIVFGSYISMAYGVFAYFFCLRGINELSVPFQHVRATLYDMELKNSRIYLINGLVFLFTFFTARICVIPVTIYSIYAILGTAEYARVNLFCNVVFLGGAIIIDFLNIYWFSLISRGAYKLLIKKKHVQE